MPSGRLGAFHLKHSSFKPRDGKDLRRVISPRGSPRSVESRPTSADQNRPREGRR